jgi:hypothetical protein
MKSIVLTPRSAIAIAQAAAKLRLRLTLQRQGLRATNSDGFRARTIWWPTSRRRESSGASARPAAPIFCPSTRIADMSCFALPRSTRTRVSGLSSTSGLPTPRPGSRTRRRWRITPSGIRNTDYARTSYADKPKRACSDLSRLIKVIPCK